MKWYQRLGIVMLFGCVINCILMTVFPPDVIGVIGTVILGLVGCTLVVAD